MRALGGAVERSLWPQDNCLSPSTCLAVVHTVSNRYAAVSSEQVHIDGVWVVMGIQESRNLVKPPLCAFKVLSRSKGGLRWFVLMYAFSVN